MVDKKVDELWKSTFRVTRVPLGDLRNQFRRQHCRTLNPYGSDSCPYDRDVCALAFLDAVRVTCDAQPKVPVGYFRKVAKTMGAIRADNKPLARVARGRMIVLTEDGPEDFSEDHADQRGSAEGGLEEGRREVRGPAAGPIAIGDLFGSLGVQPRPDVERVGDGEEGEER